MDTATLIRSRLAALQPVALDITDDSARHAGHAGAREGGGHFLVTVVSEAFVGLPRQARHRRVHALLADLMPRAIHALSLRALAPGEP
ncbi:DNA-binding transcriptional regulator BolA [Burkholderiales bacterium]|nr:DNA-binding transcriptional regulator BolA [Burkholderiales bacterium]